MTAEEAAGRDRETEAKLIVELLGSALDINAIEEFEDHGLPQLVELAQSPAAFLYVSDPRLSAPYWLHHGLRPEEASALEEHGCRWLARFDEDPQMLEGSLPISGGGDGGAPFALHPLLIEERPIGLLGIRSLEDTPLVPPDLWRQLLHAVAHAIDRFADAVSTQRKLLHLNTYLTVSSMLAKSVDLAELLEITLYCCMEAVSAEAASILLLDDAKEAFQFYRVEGPAKPLLGGLSFPVSEGVAGRVMQTLEAEIVNDVETEPHFYGQIDRETGFQTRNLIAVPLVAGEEKVGVLEVLNKADGDSFTADERLLLVSIADEIAFAVRNATLFDYIVNTYCKRRQGQNSCKGCERPLGSWTPCMRYREFLP